VSPEIVALRPEAAQLAGRHGFGGVQQRLGVAPTL
jgi:hypothetical protein